LNKSYERDWLINKFYKLKMHLYHMHPDDLKAIWI
jgi:hypothetical protein